MQEAIQAAIEKQARKLIERHKRAQFTAVKYQRRFRLRTGKLPAVGRTREPSIWSVDPHFNPKYCIRHSKYLAKTIWRKIQDRKYDVKPAIQFKIPKDSGGHREIMVFSIPDAAVANVFNRKLRDRNKNLQSPFCYSYRKDRTIFDAVLQTGSLLRGEKIYVIQYDFSKYFDSIKHEYIKFIIERGDFFISPAERHIIERFLQHKFAPQNSYGKTSADFRRKGVPQGCSLSLFLSNIASHELDRELEARNGMFVRFADDIVCVAHQYGDALHIESAFKDHCYYSGISINYEKSPGICLLQSKFPGQDREYFLDQEDLGKINKICDFDYIGHKFSHNNVGISSRGIKRIKARLSKIIYIHLLHNLKRGLFDKGRVGPAFYDWDLVTCINEIRNYIYGGLKEARLLAFLNHNKRVSRFKGLMSFYPLVTKVEQFAELDGWLVSVLRRAIKERSKLAGMLSHSLSPLSDKQIISGEWYGFKNGIDLETRAPSFVLAWRAARKAFKQYGLTDFEAPSYYSALFEPY
jgi:hypothetical protein